MARADLLCDLIKYGLAHDDKRFIQSAEAVCAEEREKQHTVLANRIEKIVLTAANTKQKSVQMCIRDSVLSGVEQAFFAVERLVDGVSVPQAAG